MKKLLLFTVLNSITHFLFAQAGTLNTSFGSGGKVTTSLGSIDARSYASVIQPDGKIVVAGNRYNGSNNDFALVRYNMDGSLDASFGTAGQAVTDFGHEDNLAGIALQPDGKIVVAGHVSDGNYFDFGVVRYNADGTVDNSFGTGGKVTVSITGGNDYVSGVLIQTNGKIVVTGTKTWGDWDYVLVQLNTDGSLDNSFGTAGIVISNIYATDVSERSILQSDGKIIVAGYTYQGSNTWEIARFNTDGTLDANFGNNNTDGTFQHGGGTVVGGMGGEIYGLALQPDGKIIAVGSVATGGNSFDIIRYNADGSFDHSFNGTGRLSTPFSGGAGATSVTLQSDGKILVGGYSTESSTGEDFTIIRYAADGTPDASFGTNGTVKTDFNGQQDRAFSVKVNGSTIYVSGFAYTPTPSFAVAAYQMDGSVLPVTLVDFSGSKAGSRVELHWHTSAEAQLAGFEVERSNNARTFTRIGTKGVSTSPSPLKAYDFADENPAQGLNFYRLKIMDADGTFTYSRTIAVGTGEASALKVFPNPATNLLQVQTASGPGTRVLEVRDVMGRVLKTQALEGSGTNVATAVDIERLGKGTYYLIIKTGDAVQKAMFIKQ